jgi:Tol biopolymer transport system component
MLIDGSYVLQVYPAFFGGAPQQSVTLGGTLSSIDVLRWIGRTIYLEVQDHGVSLRSVSLDSLAVQSISGQWKIDGTLRSIDVRPDGRAVAFAVSRGGIEDLWTMNIDRSSLRQLTNDAFFDRHPIWTGKGDRIVFQSNRGGQIDLSSRVGRSCN